MASKGYMGPSEAQSLVGQWVSVVGWDGRGVERRGWGGQRGMERRGWGGQRGWDRRGQYGGGRYGGLNVISTPRYGGGRHGGGLGDLGTDLGDIGTDVTSIFGEPSPGYQFPPRNSLVQDPGPDRSGREVLPMSTGVAILPTQSAQITARPQRVAFRPERVFISAAGTSGGAADWVVNDIKIGNRSQFSQSGDVPGDMFATNAIDGFVSFETAQTAMDVVMVVTYIGLNESGVPFFASIVGTAAI
jgi:hypothetical protein